MSLLEEAKVHVRVSSDAFDAEIEGLIAAAKATMVNAGIMESVVNADDPEPLVRHAIMTFVKSRFGMDNDDADRFEQSFQSIIAVLAHSDVNSVYEKVEP